MVRAEQLPLYARATAGITLMTSPDQTERLGFDTFGATGQLHLGFSFLPWMSAQLGFGAGAFPRPGDDTGGTMAPTLGVLATLPDGNTRPFVFIDGGAAFTGPLTRPYFHGGVGVDFRIAREFTLGPVLGYGQIFQTDGEGYSTDARSIELSATLTWRPWTSEPPERITIFRDRVIERERIVEVQAPPEPLPPYEPSSEIVRLLDGAIPKARVELLAPVLFKLGSDELEPIGIAMLHEVARELGKRQDIRLIEIQGYTDNRGDDALNRELSARRAQHVLDWLVEHGVEPERLRTAAHGESDPIEQAESEEAHEQNRRVVFRVIQTTEDP